MPSSDVLDRYVHYGCGLCAPEGWENFDASPTLRVQNLSLVGTALVKIAGSQPFPPNVVYGDIVAGLPVEDASCDAVYCSHVLEHLALADLRGALRNTYRILKPGGVFRLVLPDLKALASWYVQSEDPRAALQFVGATHLGTRQRARGVKGALKTLFGNGPHLWMWDYASLEAELSDAGFSQIRRAEFGDNDDERFRVVEDPERWTHRLGMECRR